MICKMFGEKILRCRGSGKTRVEVCDFPCPRMRGRWAPGFNGFIQTPAFGPSAFVERMETWWPATHLIGKDGGLG
jgi:hypothetical protein